MSNYGVKISKKGENVLTVTDPRSFVERSNVNMLKIAKEGFGEFSEADLLNEGVNITHNLGYKPTLWYYGYHFEIERWYLASSRATGTDWTLSWGSEHIDNNTVKLKITGYPEREPAVDLDDLFYKYFIFIEPRKDAWYE
jgi:hypothetical protein